MAYRKPHNMDEFVKICVKGDTKLRQTVGADLVAYLADPENPTECEDIGAFVDALVQWTQGSNYKVAQYALEALTYICDRLKHDFWPYVGPVLPHVIDRLGDQKDCVREKAQLFILKLLEHHVIQPQQLCDKLSECFTHKNAKVREEVLHCIVNILNEHGPTHIQVSKLTPSIAKLLGDPIPAVRDTAFNTFVEIYKHVGDRLSQDLQKKNCVPAVKLKVLLQKFAEIKEAGELLPTATISGHDLDEPDQAIKPLKSVKRTISAPTAQRQASAMNSAQQAGAVDEESFLSSMEDVPTILQISAKDVNANALKDICAIIGDKNMLWTKRIDALKKIRSLLMAGAASYEDFIQNLRLLGPPLSIAATDGRSQVSRETCVTIAYMSQVLGNKFEKVIMPLLLPNLIGLIQNSAKVIATSATLCLRQVFSYTHCPSLIPIVASYATTSKSREIRRTCCDFIGQIIRTWPTSALDKQVQTISDTLKKGIADADNEARVISRKSFWSFKEVYPDAAEALLKSLEPTYRRTLLASAGSGDHMSSSSSSSSLNQIPFSSTLTRSGTTSGDQTPRAGMRSYTAIDLQAAQRAKARTQYAAMARQKIASGTASLQGEVAQEARPKKNKNIPVPSTKERSGRTRNRPLGGSISQPTSRSVSPSLRNNYLSHSKFAPSENDSASPRPRKLSTSGIPRSTSVSRDHSRETSPTRGSRHLGYSSLSFRGSPGPGSLRCTPNREHRPPISPHRPPVMAQKILQQSREAETALAAALQTDSSEYDFLKSFSGRKLNRSLDNPSDDSEASSVCSERSYDSYRRPSDKKCENESYKSLPHCDTAWNSVMHYKRNSYSSSMLDDIYLQKNDHNESFNSLPYDTSFWDFKSASNRSYSLSGSRTRLSRDHWDTVPKDINEIIKLCASATWTERKEGLIGLCTYFTEGKTLTSSQLKKVTEIFPKMFMDQNTKVVSLFLDTLNELLLTHHNDLHDWLYMLLQRIFNKLGSELLGSIYKKIEKTLDVIRENFPVDLQMNSVFRYLTDHTQRPNSKVKITILIYIIHLCEISNNIVYDNKTLISQGIEKIISFTEDKKSVEVQNVARNCLISLLNCNTAQFMMLLPTLSREKQEVASQIIQSLRKSSMDKNSPIKSPTGQEGFTREDIHRSLRNTTAEIQNYSFDPSGDQSTPHLERDNTQDSGISQMSAGGVSRNNNGHIGGNSGTMSSPIDDIVDGIRGVQLSDVIGQSNNTGPISLPTKYLSSATDSAAVTTNGSLVTLSDEEIVKKIIDDEYPEDKIIEAYTQLIPIIKNGPPACLIDNVTFKILLRRLLDQLSRTDNEPLQCAVLDVLAEIFRSDELKHNYLNFVELITLKILNAHESSSKDVIRHAEATAAAMTKFPLATVIQIINPTITTSEDCPSKIEGSLKMLTRMIEANGATQLTPELLDLIVPNVIKAYDHTESPVRKCAVFCLVVMHTAVGEEVMKPYLVKLSGSKQKLLHLYIQRAQGSSNPTSPKNSNRHQTAS